MKGAGEMEKMPIFENAIYEKVPKMKNLKNIFSIKCNLLCT
jgi:hypothetical protein